ncbi:unnamed protein product [Prorocentrum cordatum]|uniref:Uncharacterized protein n=1 Tax=Prorocentrum cordatum TaxID=2364126 RepID=A0ABN9Y739_9DINO|nr:unnamed protein product [Polarella glacialis]
MRRLLRAKAWLQYGNLAVAIILGSVLINFRTTQPGPRKNSAVQDVNLLVVSFVTLFVWAFPQSLTLRTLDVWSSLVMFCIALASSPLAMGGSHVNLLTWSATMLVCLFNMNIRLNLVWVCGVTMSSCSAIMFGVEDPLRTVACVPSRMDMISGELTVGIVFAMFIFLFHRSHSLGVWYEMEAHFSRNELKAARSVLRSVCDAVVELDSDFRLQDEATHLVNLLLLNPHRNLLGQDLRSFLATDEDRRKFSQQMSRTWLDSEDALDAGLSSAFHVSMRDSSSIPLDVEVISVRFMNREREVAYFVGIREFTDTCPMVRDTTPRAWPSDGRGGPQVLPLEDFGPLDIPAEDLSHSSEEPSSVNSEAFSWDREAPFEAAPAAWIDVLSPTFSVRHCTPGFSQCVDTGRAGELLPAVRRSHQSDFVGWMQEAYCSLVSEGSSGAPVQYDRWLHFRPPAPQRGAAGQARSARPRRVLSARLRLDLAPPPSPHHRGRGVVRILLEEPGPVPSAMDLAATLGWLTMRLKKTAVALEQQIIDKHREPNVTVGLCPYTKSG